MLMPPVPPASARPRPTGLVLSGTIRRPVLQVLSVVLFETLLFWAMPLLPPSPLNLLLLLAPPLGASLRFTSGSLRLAMVVANLLAAILALFANAAVAVLLFGWGS